MERGIGSRKGSAIFSAPKVSLTKQSIRDHYGERRSRYDSEQKIGSVVCEFGRRGPISP